MFHVSRGGNLSNRFLGWKLDSDFGFFHGLCTDYSIPKIDYFFLYETIDGRRLKTISKMDFENVNENHDKLAFKKIGDAGRNIP